MERLILMLILVLLLSNCQMETTGPVVSIPDSEYQPNNGKVFNLNTVTTEELKTIDSLRRNHIRAILEFQKNPGFRRVEDLLAIRGIGEKTFLKIRNYFYVGQYFSLGQ